MLCHINCEDRYGAEARALPRPILYDLFLRKVPKERVHFGKKIISTQQDDNGVSITCIDGSEYKGDILVGSDGAYSAVRQNLYAQLKKENKLPASDGLPLPFVNVCLVGQTRPLTLEEFPDLAKPECQFKNIVSKDKPYAVR
jgi:2-polyprenyl-6-methoxyphenol hydroxylase-like FAD-dependent oxidoreductase